MAKKLVVKIGEYESNGQTKGRYQNIGVILSNDKGEYVLLDPTISLAGCLTAQNMMNHKAGKRTGDRLMVSVFEDEGGSVQRDRAEGNVDNGAPAGAGMDDEVPF